MSLHAKKPKIFFLLLAGLSTLLFAMFVLLFVSRKIFIDWYMFSSWCIKTWNSFVSFLTHYGTLWTIILAIILGIMLLRGGFFVVSQLRDQKKLIKKLKQNACTYYESNKSFTDVHFIRNQNPFALTVGFAKPDIYISSSMVDMLSQDELKAVIAHERHHRTQRHPMILLLMQAFAKSFFFIPLLRSVVEYLKHCHEYDADIQALKETSREILASALLKTMSNRTQKFPVSVSLFASTLDRVTTITDSEVTPKLHISLAGGITSIVLLVLVGSIAVKAQAGHAHVHELGNYLELNEIGGYCQMISHAAPLFSLNSELPVENSASNPSNWTVQTKK